MKNILLIFFYLNLSLFSIQCERDDICLIETQGTPMMIVEFFDKENPSELKPVDEISIIGVEKDLLFTVLNSSKLSLPLKTQNNNTQYIFYKNKNDSIYSDIIQFNYQTNDIYINRSCGFKTEYILSNPPAIFISENLNWIDHFEVLTNIVSDENQTHLAIYH